MAGLDRSVTLGGKFTPEEAREVRRFAEGQGLTVSDYLRSSALLHMALSGDGYGLRKFTRGAVRLGAEVGGAMREWLLAKGWLTEGGRARR